MQKQLPKVVDYTTSELYELVLWMLKNPEKLDETGSELLEPLIKEPLRKMSEEKDGYG